MTEKRVGLALTMLTGLLLTMTTVVGAGTCNDYYNSRVGRINGYTSCSGEGGTCTECIVGGGGGACWFDTFGSSACDDGSGGGWIEY